MSLLNRANSGGKQSNRLLAMEGKGSGSRVSTTPSQGATGINSGRQTTSGRGHTMVDKYFHGIDHEWSRRTGQPITHTHSNSSTASTAGRKGRRRLL